MTDWRTDAACIEIGPGLFEEEGHRREARTFCRTQCPVIRQCLEAALVAEGGSNAKDRHFVFGGEFPGGRARIYQKRRNAV